LRRGLHGRTRLAFLGEIIAANSTAALAFDNQRDAMEVLAALQADRHIEAAGLYITNGALFASYPEGLSIGAFPAAPENDGYRFEHAHLVAFQPVAQGGKRLGTLYLKFNTGAIYERSQIYGGIVILVVVVSFLVVYSLSKGRPYNPM